MLSGWGLQSLLIQDGIAHQQLVCDESIFASDPPFESIERPNPAGAVQPKTSPGLNGLA